jgi:radical SAM-linked protein
MAKPVPGGPPPPPIVQRLTIRYAKRGRMRFASHRDVARAIERGVRKAALPVAYSAGFSPHPRISYSGGAPTGSASEAEYLEISLTRRCEPASLGRLLDAALPDGIDVVDVVEVDGKSAGLQPEASQWEVLVPGVSADAVRPAVDAFLASTSVIVERLTSKGMRKLDARAAVLSLDVDRHVGPDQAAGCAILRIIVQQMTPAVRPDDVLSALRQYSAPAPASPPVVTRLWQGSLEDAPDGASAGAASTETQAGMAAETGAIGVTGTAGCGSLGLPQAAEPVFARQITAAEAASESAAARGLVVNQATRLEAGSADQAPAGQVRANEQLLRGERAELDDPRARGPNGRDCPNARHRATEPTARSQ